MVPGRALALAVALTFVACDGSSRRPGGPGGGGTTPSQRRDAAPADASGPVEGRDASDDPMTFDGGFDPTPFDGGFARDAEPPPPPFDGGGFLDAAPPRPDAAPPFDGGVSFPDAAPRPPDGGVPAPDAAVPPAQTQISAVPGSSSIEITGTDATFRTTLLFDNAGPGSETLTISGASVAVLITSSTFALTPSTHVAPVGQSQRAFTSVPGSVNPPLDSSLILLACSIGQTLPVLFTVEFTNGSAATVSDAVLSCN